MKDDKTMNIDDMEHPWRDEEVLRKLYVEEQLSQKEVGERLGCSHNAVSEWLQRNNISTRDPGQPRDERPWRDEQRLREMYVEQKMTTREIADELGCSDVNISNWLKRFGIERRGRTYEHNEYADEGLLRELYLEKELSIHTIAERFDVSHSTISRWINKYEIPTRERHEKMVERARTIPPTFHTTRGGYERVEGSTQDGHWTVPVHRLVAVAEYGTDAVIGKVVHHKNEIPWDNRPSNLKPVTRAEHLKIHQADRSGGDKA